VRRGRRPGGHVRLIASAARAGSLPRGLGALSSHADPLPDLAGIRSCDDAQAGLGPETGGQERHDCFGPSQAQARVFGQKIGTIASDLPQFGNGRVQVVDLATRAVVAADAGDPRSQELVGAAHTGSLEHMFVLGGPILSRRFRGEVTAACALSGSAPRQNLAGGTGNLAGAGDDRQVPTRPERPLQGPREILRISCTRGWSAAATAFEQASLLMTERQIELVTRQGRDYVRISPTAEVAHGSKRIPACFLISVTQVFVTPVLM
jgi:hypothetical protein